MQLPICFTFIFPEKAEDSGFEAPTQSESDKESEYMTSTEDSSLNETKEPLVFKKVSSRSSSFIQNILYEDSCTGVTVIDLFIALKSIKENLDILSSSNEKISNHVNHLNGETEIVWKEFVELLERMRLFLDKMNADVAALNLQKLEEKKSSLAYVKDNRLCYGNEQNKKLENEKKGACAKCGKYLNEIQTNDSKKLICLSCLISAFKKKFLNQISVSPEAFLGSFLASVLYWQKGQERETKHKSPKSSSSTLEEITSDGSLNIRESTVQMICDICEILNVATVKEKEEPLSLQPVVHLGVSSCPSASNNLEDTEDEFDWSSGASNASTKKFIRVQRKPKMGENSKEKTENRNELTSEGDSEFEEALTCQFNHNERITKPSVTCMGDLSKVVSGKKSASTITPNNNNPVSSWVGKLSDVIKSKIKEIKSKQPNKTNVKVFEEPFEKSETALKKHPGMVQFSITASTSAGVFDVTVVQYKKHNYLVNPKKNIHNVLRFDSSRDFNSPPLIKDFKVDKWSDESLTSNQLSESESMETCSNFGDDEMGEFLEIYVENKDRAEKQDKMANGISKNKLTGYLREMELKTRKPFFLQMQRSYPVYFVEEFLIKTRKNQRPPPDADNVSSNESEEETFSIKSSEKQEKQIVIPGSSSDLVIYIQVEIEDDPRSNSNSNSNSVVFDFEKNSLGTQTKDSQLFTNEKSIRLEENQTRGESLYNIWRAHEINKNLKLEDMERITFEEPLVVIDKLEEDEEEQEVGKKSKKKVKEKSGIDLKKNLSTLFLEKEKEIQDTSLDEEKSIESADVFVMKEIKQSAPVWYFQSPKIWKLETLNLIKKVKVPKEVLESINSTAGQLEIALRLIREIENDIVDAQIDDAISILPRLELELRKHLHYKIKDLEQKETKKGYSSENFFSTLDFGEQRDDSISGDSDGSSDYRFNNLLKLLSNLEEAVKASEHGSNKIELTHYDSSKIYQLLHALTDSIRGLEEDPNVTSLSQTLDIASRLDTAIREYDSIVKKQPADYLIPQEKNRKRRKPKWNTGEDASVTQHLKNVRKKVFEMVETEAVGMEERIERDFDRVDRLERENDEALMFLEALLQKTQKRMSEFQDLKIQFKDLHSSLNRMYENFRKVLIQEMEERMIAERAEIREDKSDSSCVRKRVSENSLEKERRRSLVRIISKTSEESRERSKETISERYSETESDPTQGKTSEINSDEVQETTSEKTIDKYSEQYLENVRKRLFEKILEGERNSVKTSNRKMERNGERILGKTLEKNLEKSGEESFEPVSTRISGKVYEKTSGKISEPSSKGVRKRTRDRGSEKTRGKSFDKIIEKTIGKDSEGSREKSLEKASEKISRTTSKASKGRNFEKTSARNCGKILTKSSDKTLKKTFFKSLDRTSKENLKRSIERKVDKTSGENLQRKKEINSESVPEKPSDDLPEKISENPLETSSEKTLDRNSNKSLEIVKESTEKETEKLSEGAREEESPFATPPEPLNPPDSQESLEQIVSSFINAIDYLKSKSTENKIESKAKTNASSLSLNKTQVSAQLTSTVKEFKVIGENSLYLSWTEPEGCSEGSIVGYEIYVDGKLNQKVRNPQRIQAVLYSVDLSKKINVQLFAVVDKNVKVLLASMDLNG